MVLRALAKEFVELADSCSCAARDRREEASQRGRVEDFRRQASFRQHAGCNSLNERQNRHAVLKPCGRRPREKVDQKQCGKTPMFVPETAEFRLNMPRKCISFPEDSAGYWLCVFVKRVQCLESLLYEVVAMPSVGEEPLEDFPIHKVDIT